MDEPTLLKVAFISAIAGIIGLFFIARASSYDLAPLNALPQDKTVVVRGFVDRIDANDNSAYLKIKSIESINVRIYDTSDFNIRRGDLVEITGSLNERNYFMAESIRAMEK